MVSQGDLDVFLARVRRHSGRVTQLATDGSTDVSEALLAALTELEMMYEDLVVADEELRVQGEELRAAQSTLATTRAVYAELFAEAPVAYLITTSDGIILEANRAASELLGNPARGGVGKPLAAYVDLPYRPELRRTMLAVWRDGGVGAMDVVLTGQRRRRTDVVATVSRAVDPRGATTVLRWGLSRPGLADAAGTGGESSGAESSGAARAAERVPDGSDAALVDALFADPSIGLVAVDPHLRLLRASGALRGARAVAGARLEAVFRDGADALRQLALGCVQSGLPRCGVVEGRTVAESERPRRWTVSTHRLAGADGTILGVVCLLIDTEPRHSE